GAGAVLQPGALVHMAATPATLLPASRLDAEGAAISTQPAPAPVPSPRDAPVGRPPLLGTTVIEPGTFFAAPLCPTILAELRARVIKIEQLDGDPIRHIVPFPEVGGIKVLQGKESIALDIASEAGRAIVLELVRRSDAVLQSFRAGVAERHGLAATE